LAIFLILTGLAMIGVGISAWRGWYRSWVRNPLGNVYVPLAPSGLGVMSVGVAGALGLRWLVLPSVLLMLAGVLLYVFSPTWLQPDWYRELKTSRHKKVVP